MRSLKFKYLSNQGGSGQGFVLVIIAAVVFFAFLGVYQSSILNYQRRHAQLKEYYGLFDASEALAVLIRHAFDVARISPQVAGVPQCTLPAGGTLPAEGLCLRTGGCTPAQLTYVCWPDMADPNSKCILGTEGRTFCFGANSTVTGRDDILPVEVRYAPEFDTSKIASNILHWHWQDLFSPLSKVIMESKLPTFSALTETAMADTIPYAGPPAIMNRLNCGAADNNCKTCTAEFGCFHLALCPKFYTTAECQADPSKRFSQFILFTD